MSITGVSRRDDIYSPSASGADPVGTQGAGGPGADLPDMPLFSQVEQQKLGVYEGVFRELLRAPTPSTPLPASYTLTDADTAALEDATNYLNGKEPRLTFFRVVDGPEAGEYIAMGPEVPTSSDIWTDSEAARVTAQQQQTLEAEMQKAGVGTDVVYQSDLHFHEGKGKGEGSPRRFKGIPSKQDLDGMYTEALNDPDEAHTYMVVASRPGLSNGLQMVVVRVHGAVPGGSAALAKMEEPQTVADLKRALQAMFTDYSVSTGRLAVDGGMLANDPYDIKPNQTLNLR